MALTGSVETTVEIKSTADKFYNLWKTQVYHLPTISSDHIQNIDLHEGEWHDDGAVKLWSYTLDGKELTVKEKVTFDEENKVITFYILEGDLVKDFKLFTARIKVIPNEDGNGGVVKWTVDYEKISSDIGAPDSYMTMAEKLTKDVDAHLLNN
ncbi:hypothetical protein MLD38_017559 [Melastoma candidum]|uniref:Uncharacterized protein n=1 Tax=Melastoma candidum TaxID=119954 RepID=A0ACB9QR43_9MYRT|nr:hypothetical protein MLD38_017559 [Melastoma candidum]